MSCPYSRIFGDPGKGFHEKRIGPYALYDTLGTLALALLTSYFFHVGLLPSIVGWFVAGEVLHYIFGAQTAFLTQLGIDARCKD